uniref:Helicase ATP-binding domain-containing protein n=1 Tax=Solanum tuberosum TaxID=4113 RepID=M1A330_SOLTU
MNDVGNGGNLVLMWHKWKEENDRWMAENHTLYLDFNSQNEFMTETIEQLSDLIMLLLRYQKEWLAWALKQLEKSIARGGNHVDDMGMVKNVQAIALVLATREIGQAISDSGLLSPTPYILPAVKGTLVICPVVAVIQWVNEIDRFTTKGSNTILVYHGANREKNICRFAEYDFVITTYSTVETEYRKNIMILHAMKWNRIILDEAHCVKDICSNTTRAILALESSYKWALSGTPLQNCVGDLYSLVCFLQIIPYSYYFCKDCDCRALDNRDAMILLKHKILKSIILRRTKKGRATDLGIPPTIVTLRKDSFDVKEEDYYTSMWDESRAQFNTYIQAGTLMNNYANIFNLLTRMRQAVDHPYLVECSSTALAKSGRTTNVGYVEQPCGLCHDPVEDPVSGISCVQLDGSMTIKARDSAITRFINDPDCIIFLMSLKAGGLALNHTVASQVFLIDPWWNAAVERQAQDRIHRIEQYKPIRIQSRR